jgi:hypothetical protein
MTQIAMTASRQDFFRKMPKEKQEQKLKEWTDSFLKKAKAMGATENDIIETFTGYEDEITFTETGEIRIPAVDPDEETLELMKSIKPEK